MSNKQAYNSIAHKLPLFFQNWWLDAVCDDNWGVALLKEGTQIVAVWPYQVEKKFGFKILRNPLLTPYLGPLFVGNEMPENGWVEKLYSQLPKADFVQWTCMPEFQDAQVFAEKNIEHKDKITYFLRLNNTEEEMWAQMHTTRRNGIRKGEQELVVEKADVDLDILIQSHSASFENKGKKYPYSKSFLKGIIAAAQQHNACVSYTAKTLAGDWHGTLWLAFDKDKIYYLLSTTAAQANRGTMALLTWNAIKDARKAGLLVFDFEGSMDAGIARFFQRFGGAKMSYDEFSVTHSPLWKLKSKLLG